MVICRHNLLDDAASRIAVALRLGVTVCSPHQCVLCGASVESNGLYCLSCCKSAGQQARHNAINDIIKVALTSAEVPCRLEPRGLVRDDDKRPDGVTMCLGRMGFTFFWTLLVHTV